MKNSKNKVITIICGAVIMALYFVCYAIGLRAELPQALSVAGFLSALVVTELWLGNTVFAIVLAVYAKKGKKPVPVKSKNNVKALKNVVRLCYAWRICLTAFSLIAVVLCNIDGLTVLGIIPALVLLGETVSLLTKPENSDSTDEEAFDAELFAQITAVAKQAFDDAGLSGRLTITTAFDSSITVKTKPYGYALTLEPITLSLLTKKQFYRLLLQEFVMENYGEQTTAYDRKALRILQCGSDMSDFVNLLPVCLLKNAYSAYKLRLHECADADAVKIAADLGDVETFLSADAMINMLSVYDDEPLREGEEVAFYAPEPPREFKSNYRRQFINALQGSKAFWMHLLEVSIPINGDISIKRYMESCNIKSYDIEIADINADDDYAREQLLQLQMADEKFCQQLIQADYAAVREESYLASAKCVEKADMCLDGDVITLLDGGFSALQIGYCSKAERFFTKVLELMPENSNAKFGLGITMLKQYKTAGIDYIYASMSNFNYVDAGLNAIEAYCRRMGLKAQLEACADKRIELSAMQTEREHMLKLSGIKDNLAPSKLLPEVKREIKRKIAVIAGSKLAELHIINKTTEHLSYELVLILLSGNPDDEENMGIVNRIYKELDVRTEDFVLVELIRHPDFILAGNKYDGDEQQ